MVPKNQPLEWDWAKILSLNKKRYRYRHHNWRKQHVSFLRKKKMSLVSFFVKILAQSHSRCWFCGTTVFYENSKCDDFLLFSNIERLGRLKIKYKEYQPTFFSSGNWNDAFFISMVRWTPGWTPRLPFHFKIQSWNFQW